MAERRMSKNALDERIIRVGLSMRLMGFGPLTRDEIKKMLEMSDGGTPPMGNSNQGGGTLNFGPGGGPRMTDAYSPGVGAAGDRHRQNRFNKLKKLEENNFGIPMLANLGGMGGANG